MGEIILVSGPSGSGKSRFAEELIRQTHGARYYIATMIPQTEENRRRIEKHRRQRKDLGFTTWEIPCDVQKAAVPADATVLLEDVSNLLANLIFRRGEDEQQAYRRICDLADRCRLLITVTISGLCPDSYEGETAGYIRSLNRLNQLLFWHADAAVQLENGAASWQKGDFYALDSIVSGGGVHL